MEGKGTATGCYKCGKPGHWSRDCPFSPNPNPNPNNPNNPNNSSVPSSEKPKKLPRSRPKLTPDLLLSDDGFGYVLRHFPSHFKYRGRGHEVSDLGNLLHLYSDWHSRLLPYYSFPQFLSKLEKVAATRRIKTCLRELRERVANGGDPTKLREPPLFDDILPHEQGDAEASQQGGDVFSEFENVDDIQEDIQEDMLNDIYDTATEEPSLSMNTSIGPSRASKTMATEDTYNEVPSDGASLSGKAEITEEQKSRMEANRLKALEKRAEITKDQRARMEANRLKALEKRAARGSPSQAS
ncbi:putative transcription factor interactor and regulator CCHC(Zn) family [Lupinus albus]|uniref:Putative transcription factor interactor and regulator CCHC(Zn) family n=1 Tax=Lupinus albus TaxID=3870 RepID=A0A6A4P1C7_LUPAL|nr:putative transcription factor interactor and regulator CCHC(Zn) family [Lupinus albus]